MTDVAKRPGVWGIDLGQCALKAIRLEEVDGAIKATAFDYIEHPKILSQPDADPDQLTREAMEKFLSRNDIKNDTIAISVPGQSGLARFVKLPPVDEKKIPDIVRFEAKQQIPFPLEEVVWAYQRLGTGVVTDNLVLDTEIGLFAMKRDMVNRYLQHFKDINVEVHLIQMAPLALCNFLAYDALGKGAAKAPVEGEERSDDKSCVVALDIGADNSNLVITDGEKIIWQRPIPLGGNHFTRALTKDLKLTFAKAEHLKRNALKSPDLKKILAALKPVLNDFVSEVQRSLGYFTNTHRDASIQYMLGLGNAFRLPGLQKYLQEKLQLEVRKLQKIERLAGDETVTEAPQYVENVLSFAVAHGLALQGLGATRLHTNLLPPEIQQERFIRAKKPWAAAAAAVLLLLVPPLLIGYAANQRAWSRKGVADALAKLDKTMKGATGEKTEFLNYMRDVEDTQRVIDRLAGGVKERSNWLQLNTVIDESLPRANGERLLKLIPATNFRPYDTYFTNPAEDGGASGKTAWENHKNFLLLAGSGKQLKDDQRKAWNENRKYLVQVNIEGITPLYSYNIQADFFSKVLANDKLIPYQLRGMRADQANPLRGGDKKDASAPPTAPAGLPKAGWVVEVRGYTYHYQNDKFVVNTLLENLADMASVDPKGRVLVPPAKKPGDPTAMMPFEVERVLKMKVKEGDKEVEKPRISHVFLFDFEIDPAPKGSDFHIIGNSGIARIMLSGGGAGGKGAAPVGPPGDVKGMPAKGGKAEVAANPKDETPSIAGWKAPSGTTFFNVFDGGGGGGLARNIGGKPLDPTTVPAQPTGRLPARTEFIIVFIWQEPVIAEGPATGAPN